jgi:hypothetical protein
MPLAAPQCLLSGAGLSGCAASDLAVSGILGALRYRAGYQVQILSPMGRCIAIRTDWHFGYSRCGAGADSPILAATYSVSSPHAFL